MKFKNQKIIITSLVLVGILTASAGQAIERSYNQGVTLQGDFQLSPAKIEVFLGPGESTVRSLEITNRSGEELIISLDAEDFTGSESGGVNLLGDKEGPYSLKDFVYFEEDEFRLAYGETASVQVAINLPVDVEPGGLYASLLASARRVGSMQEPGSGLVKPVARLGTLVFVRVEGDLHEEGQLTEFRTNKVFFTKGDIDFQVTYENNGNVHQSPYGEIAVRNVREKTLRVIEIDPWFVMPGFSRTRELSFEDDIGAGRYSAELTMYRNYEGQVDSARIVFWILPWYVMVVMVILVAIVVWVIMKIVKNKKSKKGEE